MAAIQAGLGRARGAESVSKATQNSERAQSQARTEHQMMGVLIESPEHYERLIGKPYVMADKAIRLTFHPQDCKECGLGIGRSQRP